MSYSYQRNFLANLDSFYYPSSLVPDRTRKIWIHIQIQPIQQVQAFALDLIRPLLLVLFPIYLTLTMYLGRGGGVFTLPNALLCFFTLYSKDLKATDT